MGSPRGFSTELLRDIPNREIYWVRGFRAKRDHTSFVGRDVNRDDRHPRKFLLKFFLCKRIRYMHSSVKWGGDVLGESTTSFLYAFQNKFAFSYPDQ